MYQLYYYPGNASLAPHLLLEEMDVEYQLVLVDRKSNAHKSPDYLRLNPAGRIPTLIDNETVIFESAAICLYLCEQHPDTDLIPGLQSSDRARFYQWLMYLNNTVQAELMIYFYPEKHTNDKFGIPNIIAAQQGRVTDMFALLDKELGDKDFLIANKLSVCDFFLFMLSIWADELPIPPLSYPNIRRYLISMAKRPSIISVCEKEKIDLEPYNLTAMD